MVQWPLPQSPCVGLQIKIVTQQAIHEGNNHDRKLMSARKRYCVVFFTCKPIAAKPQGQAMSTQDILPVSKAGRFAVRAKMIT
jgi:hypothetical protein